MIKVIIILLLCAFALGGVHILFLLLFFITYTIEQNEYLDQRFFLNNKTQHNERTAKKNATTGTTGPKK